MTLPRHPEARAQRASKGDGPAARAASFEGGLRPPPQDDGQLRDARAPATGRLCAHACATTASRSGSPKRSDALAVLASPAALRPSSLKPALRALFCATHSDWERFDEIFDAYWRGRGMRQRQVLAGAPQASHAPGAAACRKRTCRRTRSACRDRVERRSDGDGDAPRGRTRPPRGRLARRGAVGDRSPPYRRSRRRGGDPRACGAARPDDARAAGAPRAGAPARPAASICAAPFIATSRMAAR